jgi:drug/metabolite transporter (DMT)-like permease
MLSAAAVMIGILTYNIAILENSYPVIIMFKSCSILSAIIVGVYFSRVRDQKLKLGTNKLIVGGLVTIGIVLFNFFSMEDKGEKSTTFLGLILLLVSLIADGLLPDFQAEMKSMYKPRPVDLMFQINRWVFFFSLTYSLLTLECMKIGEFVWEHPTVMYDILGISFINFFVQMFVYYIIQKFKQHVAPFVITIRKILSVVISIFWFNHSIHLVQWFGIVVVFSAAAFDFISEKYSHKKQQIRPTLV